MKYAIAILLLVVFFSGAGMTQVVQSSSGPEKEEHLQALIEEALSRNSDIAVEIYKMEVARHRIPQASALADPELNFRLMEIPGTDLSMAMYANIELMQMVPFPGKLSARRTIAELLSEHAHHDHMEKVLGVIAELKSALAMLRFARESHEVNEANGELLRKILRTAETAYSVGKASQQEVLKTNIELGKIAINEAKIREQIITAESKVRALLSRPASTPIGHFGMEDLPVPLPMLDQLLTFAHGNRAMLIHDSLNILEKALTVGLMRKEYLPDFKFSFEYVRMPVLMENRWSVSAGITLPFAPWTLSKASSRVQEAEAEQLMLSSMYEAAKNTVESQIRSWYASLQAIEKQIRTIQSAILPQLSQSIDLLLTEYETGRTSYMMVLDGYRMYNEMKLDIAMAKMNYYETLAALEREVGVSDIQFVASFRKDHHQ